MADEIPRRAQMQKWTPAEKAIFDASQEVEKMGADARLTRAVTLLGDAQRAVAAFVDGECERCKGTGKLPAGGDDAHRFRRSNTRSQDAYVDCYVCHGTGHKE